MYDHYQPHLPSYPSRVPYPPGALQRRTDGYGIMKQVRVDSQGDYMKNILSNPKSAALTGFILFLPLFLLNWMAALDIEAFDIFFRSIFSIDMYRINPLGSFVITVAILLLPVGVIFTLWPVLQKGGDGKRRLYIVNLILATFIFVCFVIFVGAMLSEVYRCDVLLIPNCD
jgi:hypothetical protein